jgi:ferredoxin
MIVIDQDTCVVDLALYFLHFTQKESCGKCSPCRVGTWHMVDILERITSGLGEPEDLAKLQGLAETVARTSLCGLGQTAPNPVLTTLRYYRSEFLEHVKDKVCRAGVCKGLIAYRIEAAKCNGCRQCVAVCPTDAIRGARSECHAIDPLRCIQCRACYEVCRFDPLAGNAVVVEPRRSAS